jgi:Spy/CpxP family protein refolding chaperone
MKRSDWLGVVIPVAICVVGAGCGGPPAQSPAGEATAGVSAALEVDQASVELKTHHRHHHGGYLGFVLAAVETVGVDPDQQAGIDKIKADFRAKVEPVRMANGGVMKALADAVAAGSVEPDRLQPAIDGVSAAAGQLHAATADALNQLHALLRPEQRASLVDKIEAHWTIWKEANAGDQAADNARPDGHIVHLQQELGLTADQVEKTRANLAALPGVARGTFDAAAAEAHAKAFGTAFVADSFDAKTLTTADPANTKIAAWGANRMIRFYQALTPVLTPDQRAKIADKLREHANEP